MLKPRSSSIMSHFLFIQRLSCSTHGTCFCLKDPGELLGRVGAMYLQYIAFQSIRICYTLNQNIGPSTLYSPLQQQLLHNMSGKGPSQFCYLQSWRCQGFHMGLHLFKACAFQLKVGASKELFLATRYVRIITPILQVEWGLRLKGTDLPMAT